MSETIVKKLCYNSINICSYLNDFSPKRPVSDED